MSFKGKLPGLPDGVEPYDWALEQLRVKKAHKITKGSKNVVIALVDIGYNHHPDMDGHLWNNPNPTKGDIHGWNCVDNNANLKFSGEVLANVDYWCGHHVFVAGEAAAVAPDCPIMIVRDGFANPNSWAEAIRYAVDNGAKVLVTPHGYIAGAMTGGDGLFYQGTDFSYPYDNPELRKAYDYAYAKGCIITKGAADNRGRRAVAASFGHSAIFSVGSTNRKDEAADVCCSCDYTEVGTPGGERSTDNENDRIWGCGGENNYISFTGGCMASGFAGGALALVWSKFPELTNEQLRQVLRNTARPGKNLMVNEDGWEPHLGYGIVDLHKAVSLKPTELCRNVQLDPDSIEIIEKNGLFFLNAIVKNKGVFDAEKTMIIAYNGNPSKAVDPNATMKNPAPELQTKQIGHTIVKVRGFHKSKISIELIEEPKNKIWFETFCTDLYDVGNLHRTAKSL